ncbi:TonB-dependent receptor plug domain-containing protein [Thalassotalea sp. PLHSN55]|uniref:TonB-dependent receptor plug domain-containing protein n=1 Tax=Thalassotalea sp. PLHSN55 TaxID=3435888 RepID=UPI003F856D37
MKLKWLNKLLLSGLLVNSAVTMAQTTVNNDTDALHSNSTFPASFFNQYTPQNALDMVQRLPGFSFDSGANARGFGGNAGNVLIDGARPTSKSGGLRGALQRIPAAQVAYIEIIRGGVGASEAAGQSIIANVIKKEIQTSGLWGVKIRRVDNGEIKPEIEGTLATKLGRWNALLDLELEARPNYRTAYVEDFNGDGALISSANEQKESLNKKADINAELSRELAGGELTIYPALRVDEKEDDISQHIFSANAGHQALPDEFWIVNEQEKNNKAEIGIDWAKTFDNWKLRLIGLGSVHDHQSDEYYFFEEKHLQSNETSEYWIETRKTETIARTTFGKVSGGDFKPEFGIEIANNKLTTKQGLIENDIPQVLEGADSVEEIRGELFVNFVYNLTDELTFEGGLTSEMSEITVIGSSSQSQRFDFIKPRLSANYTINDHSTITFVAERTVEQLDFNDFAASSEASDERTISGNVNLSPEHATIFSSIYDWRFSERGSLKVEAAFEQRKDIHEKIFLPSGNEGLGNAGDADFWSVETKLNLPVDPVLENGLLEISHTYKDSEFYDEIIEDNRIITNYIPHYLKVDFRQDLTQYQFSWGFQLRQHFDKTKYYVDEIEVTEGNDRISRFFIETTQFLDAKVRLSVKDVNVARFTRTRYFYLNDRSEDIDSYEIAQRRLAPEFELSFTRAF